MNETAKKSLLMVVIVLAVLAVAYEGYKLMGPTQLEEGVNHPSPAKSMAQMEKEREQREDAAAKAGGSGAAAEKGADVDMSGKLGGR
jgi:hypothetical protein